MECTLTMKITLSNVVEIPATDYKKTIDTILAMAHAYAKQMTQAEFKYDRKRFKNLAQYCEYLHNWCRAHIKYTPDPFGIERIRSPYQTLRDKNQGVDCEDYVILLSCILSSNHVAHKLRVTDYDGTGWSHIYIVVGNDIVLDAVSPLFGFEEPFVKKKDYPIEAGLKGIEEGTTKAQINQKIERLIATKKTFTEADKALMRLYTGAGGKAKEGATGEGLLYEFYTPEWLAIKMWELAYAYGYDGGAVLEPSCGTGVFFETAPADVPLVGFESSEYSSTIAKALYPEAKVYNQYFETAFLDPMYRHRKKMPQKLTWLTEYPFSLVIGNPPYGIYQNQYSTYFPELKNMGFRQMETAFMYWSLLLLKPKGLLVFVTASNFIRTGNAYQKAKETIGRLADFVDAYRLPAVFDSTQAPTDILIFQKK